MDRIEFKPISGGVQVQIYAHGDLITFDMPRLDFAAMVTQGSRVAGLPDPWKRG